MASAKRRLIQDWIVTSNPWLKAQERHDLLERFNIYSPTVSEGLKLTGKEAKEFLRANVGKLGKR